MIERKCLNCQTWNTDEDYCKSCHAPISPKALDIVEDDKRRKALANQKPSRLDIWLKKAKNHRFWLVRMGYQTLYGLGMIAGLFGALMAWMAALANA